MTSAPELKEPEFHDTFERPAWWHRQQWLSSLPPSVLPLRPIDEKTLRRSYEREGIPYSEPVRPSPQRVRSLNPRRRSPKWSAPGKPHTYLVTADGSPLVKIGIAADPMRRLKELQIGQPMDLYLVWSVAGDYEHALHDRFAKYRHRGEWFDLRELGDPVTVVTEAINQMKAVDPSA